MPEIVIVRQEDMQVTEADKDATRRVVFGTVDGLGEINRRRWRRFWSTLMEYLPRIRARIGDEKVDWLYAQNQLVKHDVEYLKRLKAVMGKRLKRLEKVASRSHPGRIPGQGARIEAGGRHRA